MKFHMFALLIASCASNSCMRESIRRPSPIKVSYSMREENRQEVERIRDQIQKNKRQRKKPEEKQKEVEKVVNGNDFWKLCSIQ